jgi:hypothetical protein
MVTGFLGLDQPPAGPVTVNGRPYAQLSAPMHQVGALLDAGGGNKMRIKRLAPALAIVLAVAGCGSAATSTTATASTGTVTTAASGNTHVTLYSINSDGPRFQAIVTGAVGDHGQAVSVYPDGRVDPQHDSDLSLRMTRGSFLLNGAALDTRVVTAFRRWRGNPATCSGSAIVTAQAPVVAGSGTGAYRRVSGSFTLTATVDEIDVKSGCTATGKFLAQVIVITGAGTIRTG